MNPYSPPTTEGHATVHPLFAAREARSFAVAIALIVCANSLVPLFFASLVTNANARTGMVAGLALALIVSVGLGILIPRLRPALTKGGIAMALTQFFPLVQLFTGMLAMSCSMGLGLADEFSDDHPAGYLTSATAGFVCTTITAMVLSGSAVLIGFLLTGRVSKPEVTEFPVNQRG